MSAQIAVAEPGVSTEERWRTRTLLQDMRLAASTSASVSVGSSPSGTVATMMPMEGRKPRQKGTPMKALAARNASPIATAGCCSVLRRLARACGTESR